MPLNMDSIHRVSNVCDSLRCDKNKTYLNNSTIFVCVFWKLKKGLLLIFIAFLILNRHSEQNHKTIVYVA